MPEELIALRPKEYERLVRLFAEDDARRRTPNRRDILQGTNVQLVKLSSTTPDTSLGYNLYPASWYEKNPVSGAKTARDTCWATFPNAATPNTTYYYEAHSQGLGPSDRHIFWVDDAGVKAAASASVTFHNGSDEGNGSTSSVTVAASWTDLNGTSLSSFTPNSAQVGGKVLLWANVLAYGSAAMSVEIRLVEGSTPYSPTATIDLSASKQQHLGWCWKDTMAAQTYNWKLQGRITTFSGTVDFQASLAYHTETF